MLAAADELQAYFRGYFVFACRITKWQQLGNHERKPESPALRMRAMQRQTDGDEMVKFFGTATRNFLMRSFVVLERRRQLSFLALLQAAVAAVTILQ